VFKLRESIFPAFAYKWSCEKRALVYSTKTQEQLEHNSDSNNDNIPISSLVYSIETQEQLEHNSEPNDNNIPNMDISTQDCDFDSEGSTNSLLRIDKMLIDDSQDAGEVNEVAEVLNVMCDDGKQNVIQDDFAGAAKHKADCSASAQLMLKQLVDVQNDVITWLNDREGKLLELSAETHETLHVGTMYDRDEILSSKYKAIHHITGGARLNIVCALDPKIGECCSYTGVERFRLLTLRKCGWLDCSVINHVIILLKTSSEFNCKQNIALHSSYWLKAPKPIAVDVGCFNVNGNHWVTIEVDDRADPRQQQMLCCVFGLFGEYVLESVIDEYEKNLKPHFSSQLHWKSVTSDFESTHTSTFESRGAFQALGPCQISLFLRHNKISNNNIPDTPLKFGVGRGTKEKPLVLDTLKQSQSNVIQSNVEPEELCAGDVITYWRPGRIVSKDENRCIPQILKITPTISNIDGDVVKSICPLILNCWDGPLLDLSTKVWRASLKYVDGECFDFTTTSACLIKKFKLIESDIGNATIGRDILYNVLYKKQQQRKDEMKQQEQQKKSIN
jgi:hypothetical protein